MAFILAAPLYPDLSLCNAWYSGWQANLPNFADCRSAYEKLPSGATPVTFINHMYPSHTPPGVPLVIASGNCEIHFELSGPGAFHVGRIQFVPDEIRSMTARVLEQCVVGEHHGGYMTRGIHALTDFVTDPFTDFDDDFPANTAFWTLSIWKGKEDDPWFNPGNQDPFVGGLIREKLDIAASMHPSRSAERTILEKRADFLATSLEHMYRGDHAPDWWDSHRPRLSLPVGINGTAACGGISEVAGSGNNSCNRLVERSEAIGKP